jgi:plastocyanin
VAGMKRLLRLAGAAAAVTVAIAACSSGNDSSDSAAPSVATTTSAAAPTTSAPAGGEATSSDDNGGGSGGSRPAAGSGTITIKDFAFGAPLTVRTGATIKVTNMDTAAHDVASDDEGKFRTPLLNEGESATFTAPTQPGTYKYSCTVHGQMQGIGTLIVQA